MRKNLLIILTVLCVVLVLMAGSLWGYFWYSTKQQIDQFVEAAKPFAEINYDRVDLFPTGKAVVRHIKIIPNFVNDVISMDTLQINVPHLFALFEIRQKLNQNQLPTSLSLTLHGLDLPLHGGIIGAAPPAPHQRTPFDGLAALGCGPVIHFSGAEWQEMGYERFVTDLDLGYQIDKNQLHIHLTSHSREWVNLDLNVSFVLETPTPLIRELATFKNLKLAKLTMTLQDKGYNTRRNNYCAAESGKPVNEYIADHVRRVAERLRTNGLQLGPSLIAAYQRFLSESESRLVFIGQPPTPLNLAEFQSYKAEDVIKRAGLTVRLNDQPVADLSMEWNLEQITKALGINLPNRESTSQNQEDQVPRSIASRPEVVQRSFHAIPVRDLVQHIGKIANLKTQNSGYHHVRIDSVSENMIKITLRKAGGIAHFSLRLEDITEAEVFY